MRMLPVVAMTASAIQGDREKCLKSGMNDYVSKPINVALLTKTLKKHLEPSNANEAVDRSIPRLGTN
jgi:CheY-like chemotaxis protein